MPGQVSSRGSFVTGVAKTWEFFIEESGDLTETRETLFEVCRHMFGNGYTFASDVFNAANVLHKGGQDWTLSDLVSAICGTVEPKWDKEHVRIDLLSFFEVIHERRARMLAL